MARQATWRRTRRVRGDDARFDKRIDHFFSRHFGLPNRGAGLSSRAMGRIGPGEIALLAFLALLLFGATRIADIGKGLGEGIRAFKRGIKDEDGDEKKLPVASRD